MINNFYLKKNMISKYLLFIKKQKHGKLFISTSNNYLLMFKFIN